MVSSPSRRTFLKLSSAIAVVSAGCLNSDIADLSLFNNLDQDVTITTTVTRVSDDKELLSDTTTIAADDSHRYRNPIREVETYQIHVAIHGGRETTHEWDAPQNNGRGLHIRVREDEVEIIEVVT